MEKKRLNDETFVHAALKWKRGRGKARQNNNGSSERFLIDSRQSSLGSWASCFLAIFSFISVTPLNNGQLFHDLILVCQYFWELGVPHISICCKEIDIINKDIEIAYIIILHKSQISKLTSSGSSFKWRSQWLTSWSCTFWCQKKNKTSWIKQKILHITGYFHICCVTLLFMGVASVYLRRFVFDRVSSTTFYSQTSKVTLFIKKYLRKSPGCHDI